MNGTVTGKKLVGTLSSGGSMVGGVATVYGKDGIDGIDGKSAYEIALANGFEGTETEWLESLRGKDGHTPVKGVDYFDGKDGINGKDGKDGTMTFEELTDEQKESLRGEKGDTGNPGVYLGSGDMPEDCNVQIDPNGEVFTADSLAEIVAPEIGIVNEASGSVITLNDSSNRELQGLTISNTDAESVTVKVGGKNLFHHRLDLEPMADTKGTCTLLEVLDNGVIIQGKGTTGNTSWSNGWYIPAFDWSKQVPLKKGDVVTISADYTMLEYAYGTTTDISIFLIGAADLTEGRRIAVTVGVKKRVFVTYTVKADGDYRCTITLNSGKVKIENVQIEYGSTATKYEPYFDPQTLVVSVPDGLAAGEQFEVENFAQLHTYKPTTTITNNVGAIMEVEYVADTKAYIDNKFTELQNAILASGANV